MKTKEQNEGKEVHGGNSQETHLGTRLYKTQAD